ncbi:MAG: class II fructose-bisphosphate aldolase, partial [Ignavibacteria bacterium]|nr:class II fructose-bisphosphate aldolase [Ignavibacteria bacterium]
MPVADSKTYQRMLENAKKNKFAYPAINVTSEATANAVLEALAETKS